MKKILTFILVLTMAVSLLGFSTVSFAAEAGSYETQIVWPDMFGDQEGTLSLDPAAGEWMLDFENPYGEYHIAGWYLPDGTMECTQDGGMGAFLPLDAIYEASQEAILSGSSETAAAPETATISTQIVWPDMFGDQEGTLTFDPAAGTWELDFENPYGEYHIAGWFRSDISMECTQDGGMGAFLPLEEIFAAGEPAINRLLGGGGNSEGTVDPAACNHKWRDGVCAVCGLECEHPSWTNGVCDVCGLKCTHAVHDKDTLLCDICGGQGYHTFVDGVCACGAETIFETNAIPEEYTVPAEQQGSIEEIFYDTRAYAIEAIRGDGEEIPVTKRALVYLPYEYDPSQEYNIFYLLHGGGGNEEDWFGQDNYTVNMLDQMIERGEIDPLIVVTPTFYYDVEGTDLESTGQEWTENFGHELIDDLIPAVEAQYNTYAGLDTSAEGLKASREHRAFAGLSMGSMISFNSVLAYCTDLFGYIGSYSAGPSSNVNDTVEKTEQIAQAIKESGNEICYWMNCNGIDDIAHDPHMIAYPCMLETIPEVFTEGVNCCWIDYPKGIHSFEWWQLDLFNSLKVFFKDGDPEIQALQAEMKLR